MIARVAMSHIVDPAHAEREEKNTKLIDKAMINHPVKFGIVRLMIIV